MPQQQQHPSPPRPLQQEPVQQQHEKLAGADAALYSDMRTALLAFDEQQQGARGAGRSSAQAGPRPPPRKTAFFNALRVALQQVLAETTAGGRHTRLLAAHAWFLRHRPRGEPCADPNFAAALAASLSVSSSPSPPQAAAAPGVVVRQDSSTGGRRPPGSVGAAAGTQAAPAHTRRRRQHQQHQQTCADASSTTSSSSSSAHSSSAGTPRVSQDGPPAARVPDHQQQQHAARWRTNNDNGRASAVVDVPGPVLGLLRSRFGGAAAAAQPATCTSGSGIKGGPVTWPAAVAAPGTTAACWAAVAAQQAAVESQVARSLEQFAVQQARLEERISRRQELAVLPATAPGGGGGVACGQPRRVLMHLDSQHQPSRVSAPVLTAGGVTAGFHHPPLVAPDPVKAARAAHRATLQAECDALCARPELGLPAQRLARALLPAPDVPWMKAVAALPAGVDAATAAARAS